SRRSTFPAFGHLHGPRGTALRVTWREVSGQLRPVQLHNVAIVEYAVDAGPGSSRRRALFFANIALHDHEAGTGVLLDHAGGGIMVAVCMADQNDLGVGVFEPELLDAFSDERNILG